LPTLFPIIYKKKSPSTKKLVRSEKKGREDLPEKECFTKQMLYIV
jgi:hypothetical protein